MGYSTFPMLAGTNVNEPPPPQAAAVSPQFEDPLCHQQHHQQQQQQQQAGQTPFYSPPVPDWSYAASASSSYSPTTSFYESSSGSGQTPFVVYHPQPLKRHANHKKMLSARIDSPTLGVMSPPLLTKRSSSESEQGQEQGQEQEQEQACVRPSQPPSDVVCAASSIIII
ncbi:hypothetical protein K504DRAFT_467895 [Pleomassaria siparia CBS 279.74]|uniref:Uncharacterized protein n=1 Tax=Pleomassaria siparia CBS 279.74 TaxID=1314801 RepID=A0A6G1K7A9_9PLEO|nr:hypothetical protein K504DRAFT_467895 [Pleomassaria siparia CBS 279.74]